MLLMEKTGVFIYEVPTLKMHLCPKFQIREVLNVFKRLKSYINFYGCLWIWCEDFVWNPQPNLDMNLGEERFNHKREIGHTKRRADGSLYNRVEDKWGLIAEEYVARIFWKDFDSRLYQGGDKGDFILGKGQRVDVKWTSWEGDYTKASLKVNPGRADSDIFILCASQKIDILGWATKKEVMQADLVDWGYGKKHSIRSANLRDIRTLYHLCPGAKPGEDFLIDEYLSLLLRRQGYYLHRLPEVRGRKLILASLFPSKPPKRVIYSVSDCIDYSQGGGKVNPEVIHWQETSEAIAYLDSKEKEMGDAS